MWWSTKCISRFLYICDLRSDRYGDLSQYVNWKTDQMLPVSRVGTHKITPIISESSFPRQPLMFRVRLLVRGPSERWSEVIPDHAGSQAVLFTMTRYKLKIERRNWHHCVHLVETHRLMCSMTYLGHHVTVTLGQIFNLTFQGYLVYVSNRLDARNTIQSKLFPYHDYTRSYFQKCIIVKKLWKSFEKTTFMTLGAYIIDLRSNLTTN